MTEHRNLDIDNFRYYWDYLDYLDLLTSDYKHEENPDDATYHITRYEHFD